MNSLPNSHQNIVETPHTGLVNMIGALAMILSILQMSRLINSIIESKRVGEYRVQINRTHLMLLIGETALWAIYGLKLAAFPLYLTNSALFVIFVVCLGLEFYLQQDMNNLGKHVGISVAGIIIGSLLLSKNLAGFAALIVKLISIYFIYEKIKYMLEKKSNENIDVNELYISTAAYGAWVIYALFFAHYPFVWIPNLAFLLIFATYIAGYFWTIGKITDDGLLIIYIRKLYQVEKVEVDTDPKMMKKKLRDDF